VAVQGLGNVGADLCRRLHASGVTLVVSDTDDNKIERILADVSADVVLSDRIHASQVDLFAPCALGGGLNQSTIPEIRASFIVGAANNQLATLADDERLHGRGIIYAPDYVANAGGIINVAAEVLGHSRQDVLERVRRIPNRLANVLARAEATGQAPSRVADQLAREIIEHSATAEASIGAR
jgi:leucine dehydrogenase